MTDERNVIETVKDGYIWRNFEYTMGGNEWHRMTTVLNARRDYIGTPEDAVLLFGRGIAPEALEPGGVCCIGFCEKEQKWYGWSRRAIYGFGIGSTCKRGDCGFVADTPEGLIEDHVNFFGDVQNPAELRAECQILDDRSGIRILPAPLIIPVANSIADALEGDTGDMETIDLNEGYQIVKCGRGEWTAETLVDAKQMACDFAESVS